MNEKEKRKKWYQAWQQAAPALEAIKVRELQDDQYYTKNWELLNDILQYTANHGIPRNSSGLVEQQKLFLKYHALTQKKQR